LIHYILMVQVTNSNNTYPKICKYLDSNNIKCQHEITKKQPGIQIINLKECIVINTRKYATGYKNLRLGRKLNNSFKIMYIVVHTGKM
jgi:hypothetical protein